jgi:prolyl oligopeptidase
MRVSPRFHTPVEEMIHGVLVRDPYRWLEDRSLPETEAWICEQGQRCDAYFAECKELPAIRKRVRAYLDVEVVDQPARTGNFYFYRRRDRQQEQGCLYVRDADTGIERLLIDPSPGGPLTSVGIHRISSDGSFLAYERKHGGEDKKSIHVINVETGVTLPHSIRRGYARGFVFAADNRGFYYCQEVESNTEKHTILLHRFDESIEDKVVFQVTCSLGSRLVLTADGVHLGAIHMHRVRAEAVIDFWVAPQSQPAQWHCVFTDRGLPFSPILKLGRIFALSYEQAPNGKLVELNHCGKEVLTVIPKQDAMIRQLAIVGDTIFVNFLDNKACSIRRWTLEGENLQPLYIPSGGTIQLLPIQADDTDSLFYVYESFIQPPTILEYNIRHGQTRPWHFRMALFSDCSLRETGYRSKDGTEIPITLVIPNRSRLRRHGPVVMTSYGGFGIAMTPQYSVLVTLMLELGASFALPHIRGGGEFGKAWHDAARGRSRQAAFDDFAAAAEWLCSEDITTPNQLAIFGGSNSGLLVGVAMTQRPELFRAVLCIAPLLDMVRYERFGQSTKWQHEYGTVDDPEDFATLHSYSPYHQIGDDTDGPSVLFVSGDNDDRCDPSHVRKMAAQLQSKKAQRKPVIVDYSEERGHSPVLPLSVRIDALARRIAFLCRELKIPAFPWR